MSKSGFGDHLRREREMRGVTLDEICAATRISTRFLEALESEQWEVLPGGVFNRGFVRAVSRFLGLDEEGMVAEYAMAMTEQAPASAPAWSRPPMAVSSQERNWKIWALAAAVVILAGVGWFGWRLYAKRRAQQASEREAEVAPMAAARTAPTGSPAMTPTTTLASSSTSGAASDLSSGQDAVRAGVPAPDVSAGPALDGSLELKINADKATLVAIEADGLPLFNGEINAGQNRTFYAQTDFQISARDSGSLVLDLNGQALPPMGPAGKPGKVTLTRRDLKPSGAAH